MKKYTILFVLAGLFLIPSVSYAALNGVKDLLCSFGGLINITLPVVFGLAMLYFFWGLAQFVLHSGDPKTHEEGRSKMIWGVAALFVMVSIFGILRWIGSTIDIRPSEPGYGSSCSSSGSSKPTNPQFSV